MAQPPTNMRNKNQEKKAILDLKKRLRRGNPTAANNIAATYRQIGNNRRAFHWWQQAASPQDGDACLEVGYCFQYGIGTRRNMPAAIRSYRAALATSHICEYGREEAQYHLAIALLDSGTCRSRQEVLHLLQQAAKDGDFSQAAELLEQLDSALPLRVCRCRRGLQRRLGGKAHCPLHCRI